MLERVVMLKLKDPSQRDALAAELRRALPGLPGVRGLRIGTPADADAAVWDLMFMVRFDDLAAVSAYIPHPDHVRFVQEVLLPAVEVRKAWNFSFDG